MWRVIIESGNPTAMYTRLSYRRLVPHEVQALPDSWLCGSYTESEQLVETLTQPRAFRTAVEWFANLSTENASDIGEFTKTYGLLRWNWTQEGQGGSPADQYYFPIEAFRESQAEFQRHWLRAANRKHLKESLMWLCVQLAPEPGVTHVERPEDMWRRTQPRIGVTAQMGTGIEVRLRLGDLWQALCCSLLEILTERNGRVQVCKNDRCDGEKYFVVKGKKTTFCSAVCAKRYCDRVSAKKKRDRALKRN